MRVLASDAEADFARFTEHVKKHSGIDLNQYKPEQMRRRLQAFRERHGHATFTELFRAMLSDPPLYAKFLEHMTINVSTFFRDARYWDILENRVLPSIMETTKHPKCWSAACSTGEEPYSLAMVLANQVHPSGVRVLATDIDEKALQSATTGRYPELALTNVPKAMRSRYFEHDGKEYSIRDDIRRCVHFKRQNLLADPFDQGFDVILCRNVVIYFTEAAKDSLYRRFSQSLRQGGVLFVGCTEQVFNPARYGLEPIETFFYRKC